MTRSVLQPIRTRRLAHAGSVSHARKAPAFTPATRKTLAAIGALWVSFGTSSALASEPASLAR